MEKKSFANSEFDHSKWVPRIFEFFEVGRRLSIEILMTMRAIGLKFCNQVKDDFKFLASRLTTVDFICGGLGATAGAIASLFFLAGFFVLGYQVFLWLLDGVWTGLPLFVVFNFFFENTALQAWLTQPESWMGLQQVVSWVLETVPLSVALIVPAGLAMAAIFLLMAAAVTVRFVQFKNADEPR